MVSKNKHGLSRTIPAKIKREIRQRCGFGCVVCGCGITQYEHIDPEFNDAQDHNPEKMALLCGSCHEKVTRKIWSKQKIQEALQEPKCKTKGYSSDLFDIGKNKLTVEMGNSKWIETPIILQVLGINILEFHRSKDENNYFELSGIFYNDNNEEIFKIVKNKWQGSTENWDIETVGNSIKIRKKARKIALEIEVTPRKIIKIKKIDMSYQGARVYGDTQKGFQGISPDGSKISMINSFVFHQPVGLNIMQNGICM